MANTNNENEPLTKREIACAVVLIAWLPLFVLALGAICGCAYKGAKVVEGTDLAVGINVPAAEGEAQLQLINYLSGFRLGVDRNAILQVRYSTAETNSYLGVISTRSVKTVSATVEPCENASLPAATARDGAEIP